MNTEESSMQVATPIGGRNSNYHTNSEGYHTTRSDDNTMVPTKTTNPMESRTTKNGKNRRRSSATTIVLADRRQSYSSRSNESPIITMMKWMSAFLLCPLCAFPYFMYSQPWNNSNSSNADHNDQNHQQQQKHPPLTRRQKILLFIVATLSFAIAYYGAGIYYLVHNRDTCTDGGNEGSTNSAFWIFTLLHVSLFTSASVGIRLYNFPYGLLFPSLEQNFSQLFISTVFVIYASILLLTPRVTCEDEYNSGLYVWMWFSYFVTMTIFILSLTACIDQFLFIENDFFSEDKLHGRNSISKAHKIKRRSNDSSRNTEFETTFSNDVETTAIPSPSRLPSTQTRGSQKINPPVVHESMNRHVSMVDTSCDDNADNNQPGQQYVVSGCVVFDEHKEFIKNHEEYGYFVDEETGFRCTNSSNTYEDDDDSSMTHQIRPRRDTFELYRQQQEKNMDHNTSHQPRRSSMSDNMWNWVRNNCPGLIEANTNDTNCTNDNDNTNEASNDTTDEIKIPSGDSDHMNSNNSDIYPDTSTNWNSFGNKYKNALDNDKEDENMVHPYVRDGGSFQLRYFKV